MSANPLHLARPERLRTVPCERLEGVVFQILEDAARYDFRRNLKYSLLAVIEKVVMRRQSVASCGHAPSYLWMKLELDEDSAPWPAIDLGRMPYSVLRPPPIHRYGALKGQPDLTHRSWRVSMPANEIDQFGCWPTITGDTSVGRDQGARDFPLIHALPLGSSFLMRMQIEYWTPSDGDVDCSIESSILYVEPAAAEVYLPISVNDETAKIIGGRRSDRCTWWSVAP